MQMPGAPLLLEILLHLNELLEDKGIRAPIER
jgi:hypothetical protein